MVSPIDNTPSVSADPGITIRKSSDSAQRSTAAATSEVANQAAPKIDKASSSFEPKKAAREGPVQSSKAEAKEEIRKTEIKDGELIIKVYDSGGKLVRKIPPGYLPQEENIFI